MSQQPESAQTGKSSRGFASMDRTKQREIARKGGESVPNEKRSFSQNRELAASAGRKGGRGLPGRASPTGLTPPHLKVSPSPAALR